jgi:ParB family chromosome partitioning protein
VAALVEAGTTVINQPDYGDKTIKALRDIRLLKRNGDPKVNAPTEAEHASCPGHAAYVSDSYGGHTHATYVCTDPRANNHAVSTWNGETRLPSQQTAGGMTEEQKAERRTLIANNKAWDSAEKVRRAWLAESFLTRINPPKGAETFLALAVAHGEHPEDAYRLHADLTAKGTDTSEDDWQRRYDAKSNITAQADAASPRQVLMLALAVLVCEWESTTSRNTRRHPSDRDRRHLTALIGWGYKPSDVERLILSEPVGTVPCRSRTAVPRRATPSRATPSRATPSRATPRTPTACVPTRRTANGGIATTTR